MSASERGPTVTDVVTGEAVVLDIPCARFPSRLVALILDMTVQLTLFIGIVLIAGAAGARLNAAAAAAVGVTAIVLVIVGYPATFETLTRGKSLGKMALGLRVVSDDGGPERFRQALVRALAAVIEIWLLTGAPALICSLLSAQGKRLGDLFAGTFVIQERLPRRTGFPAEFAVVPAPLTGWAEHLELSGLQDQTAEAASSYLRRFYELTPAARDEFGVRLATAVAAQVTPPPPAGTPPAALLCAVLAVRREREQARLAARQQPTALANSGEGAQPAAVAQPGERATGDAAGRPADDAAAGFADRPVGWTADRPTSQSGLAPQQPDSPSSGQFAPPV
jgi:uncharacterized RDD family membrane protein YckC